MHKKKIYEKYIKWPLDCFFTVLILIVLSPLFISVMIAVKVKMGSPIFYSQDRVGFQNRIFRIYKFRTMIDKKDENGVLLPDKYRLTAFGRFLRSTSLDELPELINILKGDMSIVGPRPLLVSYLTRYNSHQLRRHEVRPGLTGLAQVNGRNGIDWETKFDFDVEYVDNISFLLDVKIIIKTIGIVFKRNGISAEGEATMKEFMGTNDND